MIRRSDDLVGGQVLGPIFAAVIAMKFLSCRLSLLVLFATIASATSAQQDTARAAISPADSLQHLDWRARHKPGRAALYSVLLPGAGQIYNRKYWKAPIVWAGLGVCVYFIKNNSEQYVRYRDDYVAIVDNDPTTVDEYHGQVSAESLRSTADTYRKWRDLSYFCFAGVYLLNIVDAEVDGYFVRFDVSNDLSLDLRPSLPMAANGALGVSVSLHL